ncbi:MAG: aminopeptidase [Deltaproteobacteria bacterium]|nr:aminopeptidase [Deltaproteobacteria bacterium]
MAPKKLTRKQIKDLSKKLSYAPRLVWDEITAAEKKRVFSFADGYKTFLDEAKTEREAVSIIRDMAEKSGFLLDRGTGSPSPLMRIFHEKAVALVKPGKEPLEEGVRIIVSHIDAPRLDLKQRPLYEDVDLAFLKTHYYGGIKKFQWLSRPLAIHGRIVKKDGSTLDLSIGEEESDPVFTVLDLLPHLARKVQYEKKLGEAIAGEKLNLIVGSLPLGDKETKERFKLAVLHLLNESYGLTEEDLLSAELEVVPAGTARDVGWDRSLVGAYGQDDRICAYTSLRAMFDTRDVSKTAVALFVDKEEIGSDGATGAKSRFLESVIGDVLEMLGQRPSAIGVSRILARSRALSADVNGALDPDYQEVHEKQNAARMGYGVCMTKFTGSGGKYNANDADAEYVGWLRRLFNRKKVIWQTGELGRIDEGGGGTVAKFLAPYGMDIVDCGPAILSMHSPFEIAHKGDLYMTYKGFRAFFESL